MFQFHVIGLLVMKAQESPYNCGQVQSVSLMKTTTQKTVQSIWEEQGRAKFLPTEETITKTITKVTLRVMHSMDKMSATA